MPNFLRNIAILGSTGSIGQSSLAVIRNARDKFCVRYLSANQNVDLLIQQIEEFEPRGVVVLDHQKGKWLKGQVGDRIEVLIGKEGLIEIVKRDDVDTVISALVGFVGLKPTIEAIKYRKFVALANKETLVVAGELITSLVKEYGVKLLPIDSEHSAILQCMQGEEVANISRLILTASGGPFLHHPMNEFDKITVEAALSHPTWKMGKKITIDSATLMNKGLEVIEAHWLFDLPPERIEVVIHPQSIIHSMVEFVDGSIKAQLGLPDMKVPIQYALSYPHRYPLNGSRVDFPALRSMTFFEPDRRKFRSLQLAYDAIKLGGTAPCVMNAANEVAVDAFLNNKISFNQISELIERALSHLKVPVNPELEVIIDADKSAREYVRSIL